MTKKQKLMLLRILLSAGLLVWLSALFSVGALLLH